MDPPIGLVNTMNADNDVFAVKIYNNYSNTTDCRNIKRNSL